MVAIKIADGQTTVKISEKINYVSITVLHSQMTYMQPHTFIIKSN